MTKLNQDYKYSGKNKIDVKFYEFEHINLRNDWYENAFAVTPNTYFYSMLSEYLTPNELSVTYRFFSSVLNHQPSKDYYINNMLSENIKHHQYDPNIVLSGELSAYGKNKHDPVLYRRDLKVKVEDNLPLLWNLPVMRNLEKALSIVTYKSSIMTEDPTVRSKYFGKVSGKDKTYLLEDKGDAELVKNKYIYIFTGAEQSEINKLNKAKRPSDSEIFKHYEYHAGPSGITNPTKLTTHIGSLKLVFFACLSAEKLPPKRITNLKENVKKVCSIRVSKEEYKKNKEYQKLLKAKKIAPLTKIYNLNPRLTELFFTPETNKEKKQKEIFIEEVKDSNKKHKYYKVILADYLSHAIKWKVEYDKELKKYLDESDKEGDKKIIREVVYNTCERAQAIPKDGFFYNLMFSKNMWKDHIHPDKKKEIVKEQHNEMYKKNKYESIALYITRLLSEPKMEQCLWDYHFQNIESDKQKGFKKFLKLIKDLTHTKIGSDFFVNYYIKAVIRIFQIKSNLPTSKDIKLTDLKPYKQFELKNKFSNKKLSEMDIYNNAANDNDKQSNFELKNFLATLFGEKIKVPEAVFFGILQEIYKPMIQIELRRGSGLDDIPSIMIHIFKRGDENFAELLTTENIQRAHELTDDHLNTRGGNKYHLGMERRPSLRLLSIYITPDPYMNGTEALAYSIEQSSRTPIVKGVISLINLSLCYIKLNETLNTKYVSWYTKAADYSAISAAVIDFASLFFRLDGSLANVWDQLDDATRQTYNITQNTEIGRLLRTSQIHRRILRVVGVLGIALDTFSTGMTIVDLCKKEDYDAAKAATIIKGSSIAIGLICVFGGPFWLLILGIALGVFGDLVVDFLKDKPIEVWMKFCMYGKKYDILKDRDHIDKSKSTIEQINAFKCSWAPNAFEGWYEDTGDPKKLPKRGMAHQIAGLNNIIFTFKQKSEITTRTFLDNIKKKLAPHGVPHDPSLSGFSLQLNLRLSSITHLSKITLTLYKWPKDLDEPIDKFNDHFNKEYDKKKILTPELYKNLTDRNLLIKQELVHNEYTHWDQKKKIISIGIVDKIFHDISRHYIYKNWGSKKSIHMKVRDYDYYKYFVLDSNPIYDYMKIENNVDKNKIKYNLQGSARWKEQGIKLRRQCIFDHNIYPRRFFLIKVELDTKGKGNKFDIVENWDIVEMTASYAYSTIQTYKYYKDNKQDINSFLNNNRAQSKLNKKLGTNPKFHKAIKT